MAKYLLVSFKTCPWVQRAAIVLREKKIAFEFRHIEPDNRPDWFLAVSPHKKVPVLRVDESQSLFESNAIAEYLDETVAPRLHPEDPVARAINRAWTDYVPTFAGIVTATAYADTEADFDEAAANIPVPFERLERALERQGSGPLFNGAPVSQTGIYGLNSSDITIHGNDISNVLEGSLPVEASGLLRRGSCLLQRFGRRRRGPACRPGRDTAVSAACQKESRRKRD